MQQGDYWVVETVAPAGHDLADPAFQHVTVTATETVEVTFVDPRQRGAIRVTKTAKHAAADSGVAPHAGVTFNIGGTTVRTDANGVACVDGFLFGDYAVDETVPGGYVAEGDTTKTVTVDNAATCDGVPYVGEDVSFVNVPLTNVTVSIDSQVPGVRTAPSSALPPFRTRIWTPMMQLATAASRTAIWSRRRCFAPSSSIRDR